MLSLDVGRGSKNRGRIKTVSIGILIFLSLTSTLVYVGFSMQFPARSDFSLEHSESIVLRGYLSEGQQISVDVRVVQGGVIRVTLFDQLMWNGFSGGEYGVITGPKLYSNQNIRIDFDFEAPHNGFYYLHILAWHPKFSKGIVIIEGAGLIVPERLLIGGKVL